MKWEHEKNKRGCDISIKPVMESEQELLDFKSEFLDYISFLASEDYENSDFVRIKNNKQLFSYKNYIVISILKQILLKIK